VEDEGFWFSWREVFGVRFVVCLLERERYHSLPHFEFIVEDLIYGGSVLHVTAELASEEDFVLWTWDLLGKILLRRWRLCAR